MRFLLLPRVGEPFICVNPALIESLIVELEDEYRVIVTMGSSERIVVYESMFGENAVKIANEIAKEASGCGALHDLTDLYKLLNY